MSDAYTLIQNGLIIDGTGSDPFSGDVLISGQRIVAVGADAGAKCPAEATVEKIDASGCRVMPGMIDSHCHISFDHPNSNDELFFHRRYGLAALVAGVNAQKVLRAGFTSFFDADCIFDVGVDLRDAIEGGVIEGPRICLLYTSDAADD